MLNRNTVNVSCFLLLSAIACGDSKLTKAEAEKVARENFKSTTEYCSIALAESPEFPGPYLTSNPLGGFTRQERELLSNGYYTPWSKKAFDMYLYQGYILSDKGMRAFQRSAHVDASRGGMDRVFQMEVARSEFVGLKDISQGDGIAKVIYTWKYVPTTPEANIVRACLDDDLVEHEAVLNLRKFESGWRVE